MTAEEIIFAEALSRTSVPERAAYLDEACAGDAELRRHVEALLRAHERATGILDDLASRASAATPSPPPAERLGSNIGPYKLLEQIGDGGMGVVYMAEQDHPVRRMVALKVIKPGMDSGQVIARFEAESQALAMMDHPNIAKVIDAGLTESGRPYFVMELVRGIPITDYCDREQLTPRQRLELFVPVCRAIQHAHTKGIVHRDLKPSNVLVTLSEDRPVPKVIDFGIAKAIAGPRLTERTLFTEFRQRLGTPLYMSPEQAEMGELQDVDTRSDVYSLGVLLYELLTGTTPFDKQRLAKAAFDEVWRIIREEDPPRPSTRLSTLGETLTAVSAQRRTDPRKLGQLVRGELDWIVMRALEKDRARRYETADGLARDVDRYLSGQPVEACPTSRLYRLRKFGRRNKAVLATTTAVAAVLVLATLVSTWQAVRATRAERQVARERDRVSGEKRRADEQAAIARAVNDFLGAMLSAADPARLLGDKVTVLQATQQALKRLDEGALKDQPLIESAVRDTIGRTLRALSRYDEAESVLRRALELRRTALPTGHRDTAESLNNLANLLVQQGKLAEAEALHREALDMIRRAMPARHADIAASCFNLAGCLLTQGRLAEAELLLREALATRRETLPAGHPNIAQSLVGLGALLGMQGKLDDAELMFREALEINRQGLPAGHPNIAHSLGLLARLLILQAKLAEAEPLVREALEIQRRALPEGHNDIALGLETLARLLHDQGKLAEAEPLYREVLEISRNTLPAGHSDIAGGMSNLGSLLKDQGKLAEAESLFREALEMKRSALPAGHHDIATSMNGLAGLLREQGKLAEAESLLRESLEICRSVLPAGHNNTTAGVNNLAGVLQEQGKLAEAEPLFREALAIYRKTLPASHPDVAISLGNLAGLRRDQGELTEAEAMMREALAMCRTALPAGHTDIAKALHDLAELLRVQGELAQAEPLFREALQVFRKALPAEHPRTAMTLENLASLLQARGQLREAEALCHEALDIQQNMFGPRAQPTTRVAAQLESLLRALHREADADAVRRKYELRSPTTAPTTRAAESVRA